MGIPGIALRQYSRKSSYLIFSGRELCLCLNRTIHNTVKWHAPSPAVLQSNESGSRAVAQIPKDEDEKLKLLKVAIVGVPNAGKSTLINRLMQHTICPVSRKAHTTRVSQSAIMIEKNVQVVFLDTPGVVNPKEKKKFSLPENFVNAPAESVKNADIIAVIHSIENKILRNKLDPKVISVLQRFPSKTSILILNKIDIIRGKKSLLQTVYYLCGGKVNGQPIVKKAQDKKVYSKQAEMDLLFKKTRNKLENVENSPDVIEEVTQIDDNGREVRGWPNFTDVFVLSAKNGEGVESLQSYLIKNAKEVDEWAYSKEILTDCPPAEFVVRLVKAKLMEHIKHEIPYLLQPSLEFWDTGSDGILKIVVKVTAPTNRAFGNLIGKKGSTIELVQLEIQQILQEVLQTEVKFYLHPFLPADKVKSKK